MYREILGEYGIEYAGAVPFSVCRVFDEDIITRRGVAVSEIKSAILFLVPYYCRDEGEANVSVYARAHDYHLFFDALYTQLVPRLEKTYGARFWGFADKSAIGEVGAASLAGLGKIGDNGLIINEKYGSFVFIGELLSDAEPESFGCSAAAEYKPSFCTHCGACRAACPMKEGQGCLSFVTQKKGELTEEEKALILKYGFAWGCDICAAVCPFTKKAIAAGNTTPIEFFKNDRIAFLTSEMLDGMDKQTFRRRAFSWRGKKTIARNLEIFGK
ncbi:MAG: epoxyqueuosine reductase [Ruminococcaceae bacterium]|nr:epoxyqueuosine reductase [Oscillospiraceae bacterium]MBO5006457.1 epoxyqueuosine reductase [Clostridia bacterium]